MNPERLRSFRRVGGMAAFGLLVFLISFVLSFPYDRVKEQIVAIAATQDLDVEVGEAGPMFGIGLALADVQVATRPELGKKPTRLLIPSAKIGVSPLAQMRGELAYSVAVEALDGEIEADVRSSKERGTVKVDTKGISLAELPGIKEMINLPLSGRIDLGMDMLFPSNRNAEAKGALDWKCTACVVGDGKEKLKIPGNPLMAEGISLPRIRLGDFAGKIAFEKGVGKLQGVQSRSPDAEVKIDGEVRLADPVGNSYLDLYVQFKFSDALLKNADKLKLLMQITESMGKRTDGFYAFRITGSLRGLGPIQWSKTSPFPSGTRASAGRSLGATMATEQEPPAPPPPPSGDENPAEGKMVDPAKDPNANLPRFATSPPPSPSPESTD